LAYDLSLSESNRVTFLETHQKLASGMMSKPNIILDIPTVLGGQINYYYYCPSEIS